MLSLISIISFWCLIFVVMSIWNSYVNDKVLIHLPVIHYGKRIILFLVFGFISLFSMVEVNREYVVVKSVMNNGGNNWIYKIDNGQAILKDSLVWSVGDTLVFKRK